MADLAPDRGDLRLVLRPRGGFEEDRAFARATLSLGDRFRAPHRPILKPYRLSSVLIRSNIMGKQRQGNKEEKKQPLLTPKEKREAKHAKKHAHDIVPLIPR
jgi:hypothetical protein